MEKSTPTKPKSIHEVPQWDFTADALIIGFGGAGACAAIEAYDNGASTIIFEVASDAGGSTALSSAEIYMGGNGGTRVQKACGFNDNSQDMFEFLMMAGGPQADEAKVRSYVDGSVDHFNWLVDIGVPFKDSFHEERAIMALTDDCLLYTSNEKAWPFYEKAKPCPRGHNLEIEGDNGGPLFVKILKENVEKRNIQVEYETRAVTLIVDDDKSVVGLVVKKNGQELYAKANKGVLLAAGGFVMNETMLKKYAPRLLKANYPIGNPGDTGTGILMGMGVGGAAINMDEGFVSMPFYPPAKMTNGIMINGQGQRFINEDCYHGRVGSFALQQPTDRIYMITEVEDFEAPSFLFADIVGTGETLAELEEELNIPEGQLQHTISFYNKHAENGNDPLFHKAAEYLSPLTPPLVALDCTPGRGAFIPFFTLGGLDTLPSGEVLTAEGEVIKGLYAAGRTACGIPRTGAGYGSGMSVGDASFTGRMAGIAIAKNG